MIQYYDFALQISEKVFIGLDSNYGPIETELQHSCRFESFQIAESYKSNMPPRFAECSIQRVYNTSEIVKQRG